MASLIPSDKAVSGSTRHPDGRRVVIHYHRAADTLPPYVLRNLLIGTGWSATDLRRLKLVR